jgi:hypothetical protein
MQELTFEQVEEVSGGLPVIPAGYFAAVWIVDAFAIGVMIGMQQEMAK